MWQVSSSVLLLRAWWCLRKNSKCAYICFFSALFVLQYINTHIEHHLKWNSFVASKEVLIFFTSIFEHKHVWMLSFVFLSPNEDKLRRHQISKYGNILFHVQQNFLWFLEMYQSFILFYLFSLIYLPQCYHFKALGTKMATTWATDWSFFRESASLTIQKSKEHLHPFVSCRIIQNCKIHRFCVCTEL